MARVKSGAISPAVKPETAALAMLLIEALQFRHREGRVEQVEPDRLEMDVLAELLLRFSEDIVVVEGDGDHALARVGTEFSSPQNSGLPLSFP